ncbi:MAG TPA: acetate uptake transporter [Streptosporangiaceae bacterium]|nr:acetate uptake transporter [Streptosporangiaceae bacterium]
MAAEQVRTVHAPAADPAALGLGGFALTTFLLSAHNAGWAPDFAWIGPAFFYGGLAQFMAGMWELRNRNVFGCTAFTTYGAFWLSLGLFIYLFLSNKAVSTSLGATGLSKDLGWFLLGFAIFNTYMLLRSSRVSTAVFTVFLTLEITEIVLFTGFFMAGAGNPGGANMIKAGGYLGVLTAAAAWYTSAAVVVNGLAERQVLPAGPPLWRNHPGIAATAARS